MKYLRFVLQWNQLCGLKNWDVKKKQQGGIQRLHLNTDIFISLEISFLTRNSWKQKSNIRCVGRWMLCVCVYIGSLIIVILHPANLYNVWFDIFWSVCVCACLSPSRPVGDRMEWRIHLVSVDGWNESKFTSLHEKLPVSHLQWYTIPQLEFFNQDSSSPWWKFHREGNHVCGSVCMQQCFLGSAVCLMLGMISPPTTQHLRSWSASLPLFFYSFVARRYQKISGDKQWESNKTKLQACLSFNTEFYFYNFIDF